MVLVCLLHANSCWQLRHDAGCAHRRSSSSLALQQAAERAEEALPLEHVPSLREMLRLLRQYHWIVGFTFATTYFAFPAVSAHICSMHNAAKSAPCNVRSASGRLYGMLRLALHADIVYCELMHLITTCLQLADPPRLNARLSTLLDILWLPCK